MPGHPLGRRIAALVGPPGSQDLRPLDVATAELATLLSVRNGLRAADAVHLATAVSVGADRFVTNNQRDFRKQITEVEITYPADLTDRGG